MPRSLTGSPARKRQRLSSPTYDDQVEELTQEDLAAFDAIEERLSQGANGIHKPASNDRGAPGTLPKSGGHIDWGSSQSQEPGPSYPGFEFAAARKIDIDDDPDNPFSYGFASAAKISTSAFKHPGLVGFASASKLPIRHDYERSPSPEAPPSDKDLDAWFNPIPMDIQPAFEAPVFASVSAMAGFTTASDKSLILPSKEALAKAKAKFDAWHQEEDAKINSRTNENVFDGPSITTINPDTFIGFKPVSDNLAQSPKRPVLQALGNAFNTPGTPTPAGFSRPSLVASTKPSLHRPGQFKPPTLKQPPVSIHAPVFSSPLNPNRSVSSMRFQSAASQHPLAATPITAFRQPEPAFTSPSFSTPLRTKGTTAILKTTPTPFKTPFKLGMGPGQPGRSSLGQTTTVKSPLRAVVNSPIITPSKETEHRMTKPRIPQRKQFFDSTPSLGRKTLAESGLKPQQYEVEDLEYMGINIDELRQITPQTALYYSFHTTDSTPPPSTSPPALLGSGAALKELLDRGCTLATKPWVDNHWCLVLWKLVGMVGLEPDKERIPDETKWCWAEVMRQLLYRYERELNSGKRPPLRKIANQDAPAAFPLVLCVSNIFWSEPGRTEDGMPIESHPELEVTDGWYRLRAQVDWPMARAIRKGIIRIGRKIGVAGARISTEKKDPAEILEAYDSTKLIFSGNSSHLMPWHTKLGFMRGPCISTLHSLSHDGGPIAALDFVITKVFPIAFLETFVDEEGNKHRQGPWNEAEESKSHEQWKKRHDMEAMKLTSEFDKRYSRYEGYVDRLERKAGNRFCPAEDDCPPDSIDSLYDELEYADSAAKVIARVTPTEAGWLAIHIRKESEAGRERIGEEIEKELKTICPPRTVHSFRILVIQDARTLRRPANRTGQLTVWDVMTLQLDEGRRAGSFAVGQRFMATNLMPTQASAWMDCEPESEVYLSTKRETRWTRIKDIVSPPTA